MCDRIRTPSANSLRTPSHCQAGHFVHTSFKDGLTDRAARSMLAILGGDQSAAMSAAPSNAALQQLEERTRDMARERRLETPSLECVPRASAFTPLYGGSPPPGPPTGSAPAPAANPGDQAHCNHGTLPSQLAAPRLSPGAASARPTRAFEPAYATAPAARLGGAPKATKPPTSGTPAREFRRGATPAGSTVGATWAAASLVPSPSHLPRSSSPTTAPAAQPQGQPQPTPSREGTWRLVPQRRSSADEMSLASPVLVAHRGIIAAPNGRSAGSPAATVPGSSQGLNSAWHLGSSRTELRSESARSGARRSGAGTESSTTGPVGQLGGSSTPAPHIGRHSVSGAGGSMRPSAASTLRPHNCVPLRAGTNAHASLPEGTRPTGSVSGLASGGPSDEPIAKTASPSPAPPQHAARVVVASQTPPSATPARTHTTPLVRPWPPEGPSPAAVGAPRGAPSAGQSSDLARAGLGGGVTVTSEKMTLAEMQRAHNLRRSVSSPTNTPPTTPGANTMPPSMPSPAASGAQLAFSTSATPKAGLTLPATSMVPRAMHAGSAKSASERTRTVRVLRPVPRRA